jgi:Putative peptidoglycan binding domain
MNMGREQKRFSVPEIAAGGIALAGLIAVIGVMMSPPQSPSPAAPASAAAVPPWDTSVVIASPATLRQLPESGSMSRERQVAEPAAAAGVPPVPAPSRGLAPPVTAMQPVEPRSATALSGRLLDILRSEDSEDAPPRQSAQEPPRQSAPEPPWRSAQEPPRPTGAERNPLNRSDATSIQRRLHELGYYSGDSDEKGVWGVSSRRALRDFKRMNGLQDDDKWDRDTEAQLLSGPGVHASRTFIGRWTLDADECLRRDDGTQLVIDARGAEAASGKCEFRSFKQDSANSWRIRAVCSASGKSWSADIGLKLNGPQLQWSSERGTETYVRCLKSPDAPTSRAAASAHEILFCSGRCDLYGSVHAMKDTGPCPRYCLRPGASARFLGSWPPLP